MAFLIGILVNSILISIPIGATLGTLFGIRPFEGDRAPIPVAPAANDTLLVQSLCDEFHFFAQNKIGQNFTGELSNMRCLFIYSVAKLLAIFSQC